MYDLYDTLVMKPDADSYFDEFLIPEEYVIFKEVFGLDICYSDHTIKYILPVVGSGSFSIAKVSKY